MDVLTDTFNFKIGQFECFVISDGTSKVPDAPSGQVLSKYDPQPGHIMQSMCLLIRTAEHTVLIDTGWGAGVEKNAGKLFQNLRAVGIRRTEIDRVVLSHAHPDHLGGNTDAEGKSAFPNARYIMHEKDWEFWTADPDQININVDENMKQISINTAQKNLLPIQVQFDLIDSDTEVVPGVQVIWTPGHSPGHIVLVIS
jgi:glyoxylase-like metal-dependent hydrolase (beta-lactamase superfamily II)